MEFWTIIGLLILLYVFIVFLKQLGKSIPVLELMLFIAGAQWILGPTIEYNAPTLHYKYFMYVSEAEYMSYVVPGYLLFCVVVLLVIKKYRNINLPVESFNKYEKYGVIIFIIGVVFDMIGGRLPGAIGFFAFILSNFKFAGAILLYFSNKKSLRRVFYGALIYLFINAIRSAMFHDLILWSVFFYMFWALKFKPTMKSILIVFFVGILSLSTLQTIKAAFRSQVWDGYSGNKLELFVELFIDAIFLSENEGNDLDGELNNVRLNQGWIISAIIDQIPKRQPYLNGETIIEAISATLVPRVFSSGKKEAGGRENFRKFTGLQIGDGTSMGISIIGEAYGNFKTLGGIIFMGLWGLILAKIWIFLLRHCFKNPLFLAFIPLIFLQVIKAETELVVVLNHLVKSSIVVFGFFWATKQFLNWNIKSE